MKKYFKSIIFVFICFFSINLIGCNEEKKQELTPEKIVEAFKENERKHKKKPLSPKDLPDFNPFKEMKDNEK